MKIDLSQIPVEYMTSVNAIESKPHVRFIRYLLSKKILPTTMKVELNRLGLTAPMKETLAAYFNAVMYPMLVDLGISDYYNEYRDRLNGVNTARDTIPIVVFDTEFNSSKTPDIDRKQFCVFLKHFEIETMWSREIWRFYKEADNIPKDDNGEPLITTAASSMRSVEKVLLCEYRYLIDKLLLEGIAVNRIVKYLKENHKVALERMDVYTYARYFFNFERKSIEETINNLIAEKRGIEGEMEVLGSRTDLNFGERMIIHKQYLARIKELDNYITELNAKYTDFTYLEAVDNKMTLTEMVEDLVRRSYRRYTALDTSTDRDIVKPLADVAKVAYGGIDKIISLQNQASKSEIIRNNDTLAATLQIYTQGYDDVLTSIKDDSMDIDSLEPEENEESILGLDMI